MWLLPNKFTQPIFLLLFCEETIFFWSSLAPLTLQNMYFNGTFGGAAFPIMATPCQSRHCGLCFAGIFQDFPQDFSWNKREMGFNQAHRTHDKDQTLGKANQNFWLFLSPILAETTAHFSVGSRSYITAGCCSRRSSADTDNTRMIIGHPQLLQSI